MKKISTVILLLLACHCVHCQSSFSPSTPRYISLGAYSKNFADAFSGSINQAALAQITQATAGVYGERRFMLKELSNYSAAIALPSKLGGFGIAARYFGAENFNTSQVGLGYGRKLGDKIDIGLQFNYHMIKLPGYGSSGLVNFEAGTLLHLSDKMHIGIHVYNPLGGKFGKLNDEKLASVYTIGTGYEASEKLFFSTEISKEEDHPVNIQAGLQYILAGRFFSRMGISTGTGNYFFGLGMQWKTFRLDAITNWHAPLGFTPAMMLLFKFHESKQGAEE